MARRWTFLLVLVESALLLGPRCTAKGEGPAEREITIRQQEQNLIQEQEQAADERKAAKHRKERAAASQRQKKNAESRRVELEHSTNMAIDSFGDRLANELVAASTISIVQLGAEAPILGGGNDLGISRGEPLRCFRRGDPVIIDGQQVGYDEKLITEGSITEVREKVAFMESGSDSALRVGDICYRTRMQLGKLAVFPMLTAGRRTALGEKVSTDLQHGLTSRGLTLVERDQLTRVITEQTLGDSDLLDPNQAAHIGAIVGAESILLGVLDASHESINAVLRVVGAKDGLVSRSVAATLPKNTTSTAMLNSPMTTEDITLQNTRRAAEKIGLQNNRAFAQQQLARAEALVAAGLVEEAANAYVEAVGADPGVARGQSTGQQIRQAAQRQERQGLRALLSQRQQAARELLRTGKYEAADQMLAVALLLAPNDPDSLALADEIRSQSKITKSMDAVRITIQAPGAPSSSP